MAIKSLQSSSDITINDTNDVLTLLLNQAIHDTLSQVSTNTSNISTNTTNISNLQTAVADKADASTSAASLDATFESSTQEIVLTLKNANSEALSTTSINLSAVGRTITDVLFNTTTYIMTFKFSSGSDITVDLSNILSDITTINSNITTLQTDVTTNASKIGVLANLPTTTKDNLVAAITELNTNIINTAASIPTQTILTDTLTAGNTTLTFTDSSILTSSLIDVYTDTFGVNPTNMTSSTGELILTFPAQTDDVDVKVVIR